VVDRHGQPHPCIVLVPAGRRQTDLGKIKHWSSFWIIGTKNERLGKNIFVFLCVIFFFLTTFIVDVLLCWFLFCCLLVTIDSVVPFVVFGAIPQQRSNRSKCWTRNFNRPKWRSKRAGQPTRNNNGKTTN
jgi:hypothetical protein